MSKCRSSATRPACSLRPPGNSHGGSSVRSPANSRRAAVAGGIMTTIPVPEEATPRASAHRGSKQATWPSGFACLSPTCSYWLCFALRESPPSHWYKAPGWSHRSCRAACDLDARSAASSWPTRSRRWSRSARRARAQGPAQALRAARAPHRPHCGKQIGENPDQRPG